jgi:hypothetical protein
MGRAAKRGDGAGEEWVESKPQRVIAITLRRLKADQKALSHTDHWTVCISVVNPHPVLSCCFSVALLGSQDVLVTARRTSI